MAKAVLLQAAVMGIVAALATAVGGWNAGSSALLGGLVCVVPNGIFALQLARDRRRPGGATVHIFIIGELTKLAFTVLLLFVAARVCRGLDWPVLIVSLIVVLHSNLLLFFFRR
jgi:ATP synthase protein I